MKQKTIKMDLEAVRKNYEAKTKKRPNVKALAEEFGISHTALYNWQKGVDTQKMETVIRIMDKTGMKFNQIFIES